MKEFKIAQFEDDSGDSITVQSIVKSLKKNYQLNINLNQYSKAIDLRTALSNDEEFDLLIIDMFDDNSGNPVGEGIIADNERNNKIPTIIFTQGTVKGNRTNFTALFEKYTSLIKPLINKGEGDKLAEFINQLITNPGINYSTMKKSNKIFIVHGHDDAMKYEISNYIRKVGLEPIILHEQASKGKTVIEKIIEHTDVDYGIVLYSACDEGKKKDGKDALQDRARQNVVFEHGYLIGRIGRENVCAIVKGEIEKPNDISGVVYINMSGNWIEELKIELTEAGYSLS